MNHIQSKINECLARIKQYEDSEFFTPNEKERLVRKEQMQLEKLQTELAKNLDVNDPEIL